MPNTDNQMAGPRAYGYVSDLPDPDAAGPARLTDLWCWAESQETTIISPAMYEEFFLPYLARVSSRFGLVYYGCCEPVHDRLETDHGGHPQPALRLGLGLGRLRARWPACSAATTSSPASRPGAHQRPDPALGACRGGPARTYEAARDCNVELLFRDVYDVGGDRPRLARWVALARSVFDM